MSEERSPFDIIEQAIDGKDSFIQEIVTIGVPFYIYIVVLILFFIVVVLGRLIGIW
jgi:hypothetical protein